MDIEYRIIRRLRGRVLSAVKNNTKRTKTRELLGCDIDFFIKYLESKFTEGMSFQNQGIKGWHIDHIIPCSYFDMTKEDEQKKAFHYTNLQPLWWYDNLKKSNKISEEYNNIPK